MGIKGIELLINWADGPRKDTETMGITEFDDGRIPDGDLPHEGDVDAEIAEQLEDASTQGAIANVVARVTTNSTISDAAAVGASYSQSEVNALRTEIVSLNADRVAAEVTIDELRTKLNLVLGVMRDAGLIPSS